MNCTKCGREVPEGTVFCKKCLDVMKQYPVKPGTVVQLPQRAAASPKKTVRKRQLPTEELVTVQRKTIRRLLAVIASLLLLLGLSVGLIFYLTQGDGAAIISQRYTQRQSQQD